MLMVKKIAKHLQLLFVVSAFLFLSACDVLVSTEAPSPSMTPTTTLKTETPEPTNESGKTSESQPTSVLEEILVTRTIQPTATPSQIENEIERVVTTLGLARTRVLGIRVSDWINLIISLGFILIGYLVGGWAVKIFQHRSAPHIPGNLDQDLLDQLWKDLRWIIVLIIANFSIRRLTFINVDLKLILGDILFAVGTFFVLRGLLRLTSLAQKWYILKAADANRDEELAPVITLLSRVARVIIIITVVAGFLAHYGINITGLAAALGVGGLAISLGARDTVADAIAGFIILIDRPFRIGDRIEIQEINTWGDVIEIGLRTTRIRTRDNRMVIVPNSIIGSNQVINYSYPDPRYRIETEIGIAYGTDIERARNVIIDAVKGLEFVLPEKPVDALYIQMGDSAMIFRVRWWIESYVDTRRVIDRVHSALQEALDEAGIESPFPTQSLNLNVDQETFHKISQIINKSGADKTE